MEVSALKHAGVAGRHGRSPLLRLQSDERLIALVRRGNQHAFEALVARYQARLLAFCRHMLGSREDAEDVLQDVFAAAFHAIGADERPINVRPWLYRIARNRSLNHLRRAQAVGVDSMDIHLSDNGQSTADKAHKREEFRTLIEDVHELPESQRTALLLREMEALSYEQIADAMETTIPSVKSLLVRARVSLAEAAEARQLSCEQVRVELGEVAEGLRRRTTPAVRRHLRGCDRCGAFRLQLRRTNRALAAVFPIGPLLLLKKLALAHFGTTAGAGGGAAAGTAAGAAAGGTSAATVAGTGAASSAIGGLLSAGASTAASKAAAGVAAAAIVTAGAVEVRHVAQDRPHPATRPAASAQVRAAAPAAPAAEAARHPGQAARDGETADRDRRAGEPAEEDAAAAAPAAGQEQTQTTPSGTPAPAAAPVTQVDGDTTTLPTPAPPAPIQTGEPLPPPALPLPPPPGPQPDDEAGGKPPTAAPEVGPPGPIASVPVPKLPPADR